MMIEVMIIDVSGKLPVTPLVEKLNHMNSFQKLLELKDFKFKFFRKFLLSPLTRLADR